MAASPVKDIAEQFNEAFAKFQPENAGDMIEFFKELPDLFETMADAFGHLGSRMQEEMPLDPRVAERVRELAGHAAGLRDEAQEINGTFRAAHEKEIQRIEEPRPAEEAWDVGRNN
jgi:hypothetical protein